MSILAPAATPGRDVIVAIIDTRHEYGWLESIYVATAAAVFAVIFLLVAFAVVRYRGRPPARAARWHENDRLEGGYALLLAGVVVVLLILTFTAEHRVDTVAERERPSLVVDVIGSKWEWTFRYPAYGITQHAGTIGASPLVVPAGEAVRFNLRTLDVIHAFWVPYLRYKRDLMPGSTQAVTLDFDRTGLYQGQCAEFCGYEHAQMLFAVRVLNADGFNAWARANHGASEVRG
jgi:cytochrome c oxidase subunit 2